jgi:hypothetical protein
MAAGCSARRFDTDDRRSVHIYPGSLVEVQTDALVSSSHNCLSTGGGVSAAPKEQAGGRCVSIGRIRRHNYLIDGSHFLKLAN